MKRFVSIAIAVVLTCMAALVNTAYAEHETGENDNGTEFHVVDDLYVGGWGGTWSDPDVEIYGFSVFGSSTVAGATKWSKMQSVISPSTGSVVILGNLAVASTAYIEGITIATSAADTSKLTFENGAANAGKVLQLDSNGYVKFVTPSSIGDNLGNHTATQNLNMNNYAIVNVSSMTFSNESLAISSGSAYFGGKDAGITVSTNVEVIGAIKADNFYGNASGLTGVATLNNTTPWRILRVDNNQKVVDAGMFQVGADTFAASITVDASSFTVVNTALFGSSVTINGDSNNVGLVVASGKSSTFGGNVTVNANATIGNDTVNNTQTINGAVSVHANPASKKLMQVDDGSNVVAYFKKK